ncbi:BSD-domain-containing protein [Xylariomycetidae sp. FL2044]|nr:BSD-domain-containing protein [Xylariomycetidae sp. FL2044]
MDLAYDHIVEESLPKEDDNKNNKKDNKDQNADKSAEHRPDPQSTLNEDLQEAYRAFSSSTWGSWIGGTVGKVVKQGESVYREASQEVSSLGVDATRGLASLRARAISLTLSPQEANAPELPHNQQKQEQDKGAETPTPTAATSKEAGRSSEDRAAAESETVMARLRMEAAKRLKDIQRAEDAADEALLKFGSNVRDFFRDAVIVNPGGIIGSSSSSSSSGAAEQPRFESKDEAGKRVIHTSRYDAQLHVLHTTEKSFAEDPATAEYAGWGEGFDIDSKTDDISRDLARYPELRSHMERLVPDRVPYADFWKRYYFMRHSIDSAEARRRDLLKAASAEEEVGWGEDSDDESASQEKPAAAAAADKPARPGSTESSTTIHPPTAAGDNDKARLLRPSEPRKSNDEKSQPDSDTSYDLVGATSGNPSQAPSSPKEARKVDDSDDEEWE